MSASNSFIRQSSPDALELFVGQNDAENHPFQFHVETRGPLEDFDREYVNFSGFFGKHGPYVFAAAPELLEVAQGVLPANVCLTNPNVRDDLVIPLDVTMGELRKIAAAIAKATGAA